MLYQQNWHTSSTVNLHVSGHIVCVFLFGSVQFEENKCIASNILNVSQFVGQRLFYKLVTILSSDWSVFAKILRTVFLFEFLRYLAYKFPLVVTQSQYIRQHELLTYTSWRTIGVTHHYRLSQTVLYYIYDVIPTMHTTHIHIYYYNFCQIDQCVLQMYSQTFRFSFCFNNVFHKFYPNQVHVWYTRTLRKCQIKSHVHYHTLVTCI